MLLCRIGGEGGTPHPRPILRSAFIPGCGTLKGNGCRNLPDPHCALYGANSLQRPGSVRSDRRCFGALLRSFLWMDLEGRFPTLVIADPDGIIHAAHENLAVADPSCARRPDDRLNGFVL